MKDRKQKRLRDRYFATADREIAFRGLADEHFTRGEWNEAFRKYLTLVRAIWPFDVPTFDEIRFISMEDRDQGIDSEIADSIFARAAYAVAKLGDFPGALTIAEEGRSGRLRDMEALSYLPDETHRAIEGARANLHSLKRAILETGGRMVGTYSEIQYGEAYCMEHIRLREIISNAIKRHPRFEYPRLSQSEMLQAIPKQGAAIVPIITAMGSIIFVIPSGTRTVGQHHAVWLPGFTSKNLRQLLLGTEEDPGFHRASYVSAMLIPHRGERSRGRSAATEFPWDRWKAAPLTLRLWRELLADVHTKLLELNVPPNAQILFVTDGSAVIPLHSAWREVSSKPKYFADEYISSYAPNFYSLHRIHRRLAQQRLKSNRLVAVIDPTGDLSSAPLELAGLSDAWKGQQMTTLIGSDATVPSLRQCLPGSTHLHFACHGFRDWIDGLGSGIILAGDHELTAQEVSGLELSDVSLVVLSSCETGAIDYMHSQAEWTGLPEAFLEAGALGIICSVWAVNDVASALLMRRFYRQLVNGQKDHPTALHDAQMWLKNATAHELTDFWEEPYKLSKDNEDENAEQLWRMFKAHPDAVPFSDPYFWAGFILVGT
jgi:CHAT domain-containing protein